jgi:hypothetical protein
MTLCVLHKQQFAKEGGTQLIHANMAIDFSLPVYSSKPEQPKQIYRTKLMKQIQLNK